MYGSIEESVPTRPYVSLQDKSSATGHDQHLMSPWAIASILSTAFSYGCTMTTFFLLVLPLECRRIEAQVSSIMPQLPHSHLYFIGNKSVALGIFAAIAGMAQLVSPLIGLLSDNYRPPKRYQQFSKFGQRLPYIFLGTLLILLGISWEFFSSSASGRLSTQEQPSLPQVMWPWLHYLMAFLLHNIGLNVVYTVMIALIPDLVPLAQIGQANGIFALLLVVGSLFGFAIFQTVVSDGSFFSFENSVSSSINNTSDGINILGMYKVYFGVSIASTVLTYHFVMQRLDQSRNVQHSSTTMLRAIPISEQPLCPNPAITTTTSCLSNDSNTVTEKWPPVHLIVYFILYEPIEQKSFKEIRSAYWVESTGIYHDFFIVTISRLFYYMGISCQTFFLYFVHDVSKTNTIIDDNNIPDTQHPLASTLERPEVVVAILAIIAQISGAVTCYPIGIISDKYFEGRRKPFVYLSCLLLCIGYLTLLLCKNLNEIMGICVLLGAANGMYLTMDTSLAVDTLPSTSDNEKNHIDAPTTSLIDPKSDFHGAAQLLGVWGVFGFVGSAAGPFIGGMALFIFGQPKAYSDCYYSFPGYCILFSLSAVYFFGAAVALSFIQKKGV